VRSVRDCETTRRSCQPRRNPRTGPGSTGAADISFPVHRKLSQAPHRQSVRRKGIRSAGHSPNRHDDSSHAGGDDVVGNESVRRRTRRVVRFQQLRHVKPLEVVHATVTVNRFDSCPARHILGRRSSTTPTVRMAQAGTRRGNISARRKGPVYVPRAFALHSKCAPRG
jgi:hypothetical protein